MAGCYNPSMSTITPQDLQRDPLGLLARVQAGERLVVVDGEQPVAELVPVAPARKEPRPFGLCAGQFTVPDDFDDPLPEEVLRDFEGQ